MYPTFKAYVTSCPFDQFITNTHRLLYNSSNMKLSEVFDMVCINQSHKEGLSQHWGVHWCGCRGTSIKVITEVKIVTILLPNHFWLWEEWVLLISSTQTSKFWPSYQAALAYEMSLGPITPCVLLFACCWKCWLFTSPDHFFVWIMQRTLSLSTIIRDLLAQQSAHGNGASHDWTMRQFEHL